MATLYARAVLCGEVADGAIGVIVAEEASGEGARVELLRGNIFDDQDRALGQDTYSLSLETGACVYGGVTRWWLAPGRLKLTLSKEAADALGLDTELTIEFDTQQPAELEEWLPKVLAMPPAPS